MKPLIAAWSLCLLMTLITACDPMTDVTFVNETHQNLEFYTEYRGRPQLGSTISVAGGSSARYSMIAADYANLRVAATREDGEWVFDRTYTRDEMEKAKRTVTVSSLAPIAPPSDVQVFPSAQATPPRSAPTRTPVASDGVPASGLGPTGTPAVP